jgi:hypothetical protein
LKNAIFWDVMPCGSCKSRHFGGTYRCHHQGGKMVLIGRNETAKFLAKVITYLFLYDVVGI